MQGKTRLYCSSFQILTMRAVKHIEQAVNFCHSGLGKRHSESVQAFQALTNSVNVCLKTSAHFLMLPLTLNLLETENMETKTYKCICGHIAYYIKGKGFCCICNNPRKA